MTTIRGVKKRVLYARSEVNKKKPTLLYHNIPIIREVRIHTDFEKLKKHIYI